MLSGKKITESYFHLKICVSISLFFKYRPLYFYFYFEGLSREVHCNSEETL